MSGRPDFDELGLHPLPRTPERAPDVAANLQNDAAALPSTPEAAASYDAVLGTALFNFRRSQWQKKNLLK